MALRTASGRQLAALALSLSALACWPAGTACAQWREGYQSDWLGTAPHNEGYGENVWGQVDYTVMRLSGQYLPALVTSSPIGTPRDDAAELGRPATTVVAGEDTVGDAWRSGIRVRGGVWLESWQQLAFVGDYFNIGEDRYRFTDGNSQARFVGRPFFNVRTNEQDAEFGDIPGEFFGSARVRVDDEFESAGAGFQWCIFQAVDCYDSQRTARLDLVSGYRFYNYSSLLRADHNSLALAGNLDNVPAGTRSFIQDRFDGDNEFHGGDIALDGRIRQGGWWIEGLARVAVGANRRSVDIDGRSIEVAPNGITINASLPGGLLTSPVTNIGRRADTETGVIPELRIGLGCQLMPRLAARVGYHVIVWDNVVQASSHLPPFLGSDPFNLPNVQAGGSDQPLFPGLQETTVVAHGLDFGLELAY